MSEESVKKAEKEAKEVDTPVAKPKKVKEVDTPDTKPKKVKEVDTPDTKSKKVKEEKAPSAKKKEAAKVKEPAETAEVVDKDAAAPETDAGGRAPRSEAANIMSAGDEEADKAAESARKKGRGKSIPAGIAFVRSTFNNTIVSIADARGGVISWSSAGKAGFKGSRKSTAFAATMVAQDAARQAISKGMHEVEVRIQGAGAGRESAVRAIQQAGISISSIKDCTPIPHNGCRPRKRRRV
ncbi:MAG: 30S ribosomal protein S11 [Kiritimatiellia bacterium]|jgi:small subunit ribosomal protein S11